MSVSAHSESKIRAHLPPTVGNEFVTLLNANGGGVAQSAVSPVLERYLNTTFGHETVAEFVTLLNAVGKNGTPVSASVELRNRVRVALGTSAGAELESILTNIH